MNFILASSSPRRIQMFKDLKVKVKVISANIDESVLKNEKPETYVKRLAYEKAFSVFKKTKPNSFVLAADTIVVFKNKILGKPVNKAAALKTLQLLSGNTHQVYTAWCWIGSKGSKKFTSINLNKTEVKFSKKNKKFWQWYVQTKEPMDKAGSYGAQSIGMSFIEKINGSYSNVIGLPLNEVLNDFQRLTEENFLESFL